MNSRALLRSLPFPSSRIRPRCLPAAARTAPPPYRRGLRPDVASSRPPISLLPAPGLPLPNVVPERPAAPALPSPVQHLRARPNLTADGVGVVVSIPRAAATKKVPSRPAPNSTTGSRDQTPQ